MTLRETIAQLKDPRALARTVVKTAISVAICAVGLFAAYWADDIFVAFVLGLVLSDWALGGKKA